MRWSMKVSAAESISMPIREPWRCHSGVTPSIVIGPISAIHNAVSAALQCLWRAVCSVTLGAANRLTLMVFWARTRSQAQLGCILAGP
jgi:hypothetical protein